MASRDPSGGGRRTAIHVPLVRRHCGTLAQASEPARLGSSYGSEASPRDAAVMTPQPLPRRKRRPRVFAGVPTPQALHRRKRRPRVFAGALTALRLPRRRRRPARDSSGDRLSASGVLAPSDYPDEPEAEGGVGVREPRWPKPSGLSGAAALSIPDSDEDTQRKSGSFLNPGPCDDLYDVGTVSRLSSACTDPSSVLLGCCVPK